MRSTTAAVVKDGAMDAVERSWQVLPEGVRLGRNHPDSPESRLSRGKFEPAYDDNTTIDGPHRFAAGYWVIGCDGRDALTRFVGAWADWGWAVDDRSDGRLGWVRATSPEGYRLVGRLTDDGRLSLSVSSPTFPFDGFVTSA